MGAVDGQRREGAGKERKREGVEESWEARRGSEVAEVGVQGVAGWEGGLGGLGAGWRGGWGQRVAELRGEGGVLRRKPLRILPAFLGGDRDLASNRLGSRNRWLSKRTPPPPWPSSSFCAAGGW